MKHPSSVASAYAAAVLLASAFGVGCSDDGLRLAADVNMDGELPVNVALQDPTTGGPLGFNVTGEVPVSVSLDTPSGQPIGLNVNGEVPVNVSLAGLGDKPLTLALSGDVPVNVTLQMPDGGGATGTYVSAETMNTFTVNETKAEVVDAVLGPPDRVSNLSDGSAIWVWEFGPATPLVQVNVIGGGDSDKPAGTFVRCFVQIRDGVVVALGRG